MYYYFILTVAWTLIILTMLATFCLFLIISRSKSCFNVHLPSWSQFSFSFTPTKLCLYSSNTSPLWICLFLSHLHATVPYVCFQPLFYRRIFSEVFCIHEVLVAFPYRRDLQYLNNIPDHAQYPVKRCDQGAYMYHCQTSQGSEVMNAANINIRAKGSACPVNAAMLTIIEQVGRLWNKILFVGAQKTLQGTIFYQWNNLGHRWRGGCSRRRKEWSNWQRVEADKRWRFALNHTIPMAQRNMLQDLPLRSSSSPCTWKLTRMLRIRRQLHRTLCGSSTWNGNDATCRHHPAKLMQNETRSLL